MQGIEEAFAYEVEATEQARIERYFRELASGGRVKDFIIFETSDHTIFAFLEMPVLLKAEAAIRGLNATELKGQPLTVNEARPRTLVA